MIYSVRATMPTKVKSIEDYKERIHEIFDWQIRQTIGIRTMILSFIFKEKVTSLADLIFRLFLGILETALIIVTLPFALVCVVISLVDALWTTIALPLYFIPVIRILPLLVSGILYGAYFAVGLIGIAALTDDMC